MHKKSKKFELRSIQLLLRQTINEILNGIRTIKNKYLKTYFMIDHWHVNNDFDKEKFRNTILPELLETYGHNEHVGCIERSIRTIKERERSTCAELSYKILTKLMIRELMAGIVWVVNTFASSSKSSTISPESIMEGQGKPDMNNNRLCFGQYAQVYIDTDNTLRKRSISAIALQPSNENGGHFFMILEYGRRLHSYEWISLPITQWTINLIELMAKREATRNT